MRTLKALLVDHDGTLVDSEPFHYRLWRDILEQYGIKMSLDEYVSHHAGLSSLANAERMLQLNPSAAVSAEALAVAKDRGVDEFLEHSVFPLQTGARELFDEALSHGALVGVVSGAEGPGLIASLKAHDLNKHLSAIVSGDEVDNGKPAPDSYLLGAERIGVEPGLCVAIEDTEAGVNAATAAGMTAVAVPTPMSASHDFSAAALVANDLRTASRWIWSQFEVAR